MANIKQTYRTPKAVFRKKVASLLEIDEEQVDLITDAFMCVIMDCLLVDVSLWIAYWLRDMIALRSCLALRCGKSLTFEEINLGLLNLTAKKSLNEISSN